MLVSCGTVLLRPGPSDVVMCLGVSTSVLYSEVIHGWPGSGSNCLPGTVTRHGYHVVDVGRQL